MAYIERFYRRYHSYYFEDDSITIRVLEKLTQKHIDWILHDYKDIIPKGDIVQLDADANDPEPALACLPRLRFTFKRGDYARLKDLIDIIND